MFTAEPHFIQVRGQCHPPTDSERPRPHQLPKTAPLPATPPKTDNTIKNETTRPAAKR